MGVVRGTTGAVGREQKEMSGLGRTGRIRTREWPAIIKASAGQKATRAPRSGAYSGVLQAPLQGAVESGSKGRGAGDGGRVETKEKGAGGR